MILNRKLGDGWQVFVQQTYLLKLWHACSKFIMQFYCQEPEKASKWDLKELTHTH